MSCDIQVKKQKFICGLCSLSNHPTCWLEVSTGGNLPTEMKEREREPSVAPYPQNQHHGECHGAQFYQSVGYQE